MERHLNLIKNETGINEKRVLPRFPFCYLIFKTYKDQERSEAKVFEVKDISRTGMQLGIKEGKHDFHKSSTFIGSLHWISSEIEVQGRIKWVTPHRVGVEFDEGVKLREDINKFLDLEQITKHIKPLHNPHYELETPTSLKYWLRADGPLELFVWTHPGGEFKIFQIIILDKFIEWEDIHGIKTGKLLSKRDLDTPLITEDEFIFSIDQDIDTAKEDLALKFLSFLPPEYLPHEVIEFIKLKLAHKN